MPAYLERLDTYDNLTDAEKKIFRMWMSDFMPAGIDYKFRCEPINFSLPENFIGLWQKYPENPAPHLSPLESLNLWRNKLADELSIEKIGYLPPSERLIRYGSIDGKKFNTLLMDLQALSSKVFKGIDFELPKMFMDMWKNHPENLAPNSDPMETLTEYCKRINDEIRNPDKYVNPQSKPVLRELSNEAKEALRAPPPTMLSPIHSFLNTATFDYDFIKSKQDEFAQRDEPATIGDYVLVRATDDFPISGYHTPVNRDTRMYEKPSFLGPKIVSFGYSDITSFALNGLTKFATEDGRWSNCDFNIIEPLTDHIKNPNLSSLHPRKCFF